MTHVFLVKKQRAEICTCSQRGTYSPVVFGWPSQPCRTGTVHTFISACRLRWATVGGGLLAKMGSASPSWATVGCRGHSCMALEVGKGEVV